MTRKERSDSVAAFLLWMLRNMFSGYWNGFPGILKKWEARSAGCAILVPIVMYGIVGSMFHVFAHTTTQRIVTTTVTLAAVVYVAAIFAVMTQRVRRVNAKEHEEFLAVAKKMLDDGLT